MSNEHSLFFPQTETGETPVYNYPTVRTRISAPCPGKLDNIITLVSGKDAIYGISRPKNIGTCALHIAFYDQSGAFIGAVKMEPDESHEIIRPPNNTHTIKFGCNRACTGTAVLEYDTPNIS